MTEELSATQQDVLRALEQVIDKTQKSFIECGNALAKIRDDRLYRASHANFETYCQERWGWGRSYCNKLISAVEAVESLPKRLGTTVPSERAARAIAEVPEEDRKAVMQAVKESKEPVTAKAIEQAAEKIVSTPKAEPEKPKIKPEPPKLDVDETGFVIPEKILAEWNRACEVGKRMASGLKETRLELERGIDEKDKVFGEVTNTTIAGLKLAEAELRRIIPHAVCPNCSGRTPAQCGKGGLCKGRGWVSRFSYDNHLTPELKKVREKGIKK